MDRGNNFKTKRPYKESNPMLYTPSPSPPSPQPYSPTLVLFVHDKLPWMSYNDATHANSWRRLGSEVRVARWTFRDSTVLETLTFAAMKFRWTFLWFEAPAELSPEDVRKTPQRLLERRHARSIAGLKLIFHRARVPELANQWPASLIVKWKTSSAKSLKMDN